MKACVEALGAKLKKISPTVGYAPKLNGSLRRIHRDTRFSNDKSPYKTHLDLWFWDGKEAGDWSPGFWFRLTPKQLMVGAGVYVFEPPVLAAYRKAVADPKKGAELAKLVAKAEKDGLFVGGETYKRVPKDFPPDHPNAKLLKHSALYVGWEGAIPKELTTSKFVDVCIGHLKPTAGVHAWLVKLGK